MLGREAERKHAEHLQQLQRHAHQRQVGPRACLRCRLLLLRLLRLLRLLCQPCSRIGGRVVGRSGRRGGGSGGDGSLVEEEAHRHREHLLHILPHHRRRLGVLTPLRTAAAAATTGARATAATATAAAAAAAAPRPRANPGRSLNRVARERRKEAGYSALQNPPLDAPSEVRLPLSDFDRLAAVAALPATDLTH